MTGLMKFSRTPSRSLEMDQILDVAIERVADEGLRNLTLRDLAQAVGKSTTFIVNLFGAKADIIQSVGEEAFRRDTDFHADFFSAMRGLQLDRDSLLTLIQAYLRLRAGTDARFVRVWEELLLDPDTDQRRQDLMRRWEAMRLDTWRNALETSPGLAGVAAPIVACLTIEQFYAGVLLDQPDYGLIAAEGLAGLIDHALERDEGPATATLWYAAKLVMPQAPDAGLEPDAMKRRLLDIAADQILAAGLGAISNRSVTAVAGTSTSTLAYHWPDMRRFVLDAVWHSVFRDMPRYLAGHPPERDPDTADMESWTLLMTPTVAIRPDAEGFYVRYARLIASICVEARRDPSLRDLAMLLRGLEGGGTFHNRAGVWPEKFNLTRLAATRFALWIKGAVLASSATGVALTSDDLREAAMRLVSSRQANTRHFA